MGVVPRIRLPQVLGLLEEARNGRAISGPVIERAGSSPLSPSSANALFANANTVRAFHTGSLQEQSTFLRVLCSRKQLESAVLSALWLQAMVLPWLAACSGACVIEDKSRA